MKKKHKYQEGGKTTSDMDLAFRLANAEAKASGKAVSDVDIKRALTRLSGKTQSEKDQKRQMVLRMLSELDEAGTAGGRTGATGRLGQFARGAMGMQYGGMADMSAAPMIKQPQRKKRKASGFRTKYSKGGGVRKSKYSL